MIVEEMQIKDSQEAKIIKFFQCEICSKELDSSLVFWCRKNKERFRGKLLCKEHQRRT